MKYVSQDLELKSNKSKRKHRTTSSMSSRTSLLTEKQIEERWQKPVDDSRHDLNTLPIDPRDWVRGDVRKWLINMAETHNIRDLHLERFLMNGKALCLMSLEMYLTRVPLGGKMLYRDFQLRLGRAMWLKNECS